MKCPRCGHDELTSPAPCPGCGFSGPQAQVEELSHVRYLLGELAGWQGLSQNVKEQLQTRYLRRRRELEVELELCPPPLSPQAARDALRERMRLRQLLVLVSYWVKQDWIEADAASALVAQAGERDKALRARLSEPDTPVVAAFDSSADRVALLRGLRDELDKLHQEDAWADEDAYRAAVINLGQRVERLEIELGLRRRPRKKAKPAPVPSAPPPTPIPPRRPREPITWERIWRTLLSERTLRVLLFVGVFLLFASAVTLVVYNWERFSPLVQVAILTGFTLFFYGLGWYVRTRMGLPQSGIALFATGSLLVPVDFYAIYLSGGIFPRGAWAEVWLTASSVCLGAYIVTAVVLRAEFFGYLVGVAAGSLLCAAFQVGGVSTDWWSPALSGLALLLLLLQKPGFFRETWFLDVFGRPFRQLALLTVTSVLSLATGLCIAGQLSHPSFRLPLALDWWLACAVYTIAAARYPRRALASGACVTAPVALYLTLALRFEAAGVNPAWHALGWALLTPVYLVVGWRLQRLSKSQKTLEAFLAQGRIVVGWTIVLMLLVAVWGFGDMSAAAAAHGVLAGSVILAVGLWRRSHLLFYASLLSLSATTTWMAARGLDLAQYSLGWALLAILHVIAAVLLRRADLRPPQGAYTWPLYLAAAARRRCRSCRR